MIIAIDGPAAAGKGTLARRLARYFGFAHLDSGLLYRAVALRLLRDGSDPGDRRAALAAANSLSRGDLGDPALRGEAVGAAASRVAALPELRGALIRFQRDFARHPPDGAPGAVIDGRDIATVICPDADIKFFVTADFDERVRRRHAELTAAGDDTTAARVGADLKARDARDAGRSISPLRQADDAHLLDTTNLDIDSAFRIARDLVARIKSSPDS